jgi:hypothetical protein
MKKACQYCKKMIDARGMPSHVHFRHALQVSVEFSLNWQIQWFLYGEIRGFTQLQLGDGRR